MSASGTHVVNRVRAATGDWNDVVNVQLGGGKLRVAIVADERGLVADAGNHMLYPHICGSFCSFCHVHSVSG